MILLNNDNDEQSFFSFLFVQHEFELQFGITRVRALFQAPPDCPSYFPQTESQEVLIAHPELPVIFIQGGFGLHRILHSLCPQFAWATGPRKTPRMIKGFAVICRDSHLICECPPPYPPPLPAPLRYPILTHTIPYCMYLSLEFIQVALVAPITRPLMVAPWVSES